MNHRDLVCDLVRLHGWRRGAELGVASGHLSRRLLERFPDLHLIGVDTLVREDRAERVRALVAAYPDRYELLPVETSHAADHVHDNSLDFVFIDAGHSYEAVYQDIELWQDKVRPEGYVLGHDYGHPKYDGVARAVDEWFGETVSVLEHTVWIAPRSVLP